ATVNHASDARRAQGERQWCVTGMFWGVVKLNGELGNRLAAKIRDENRKARVTQSAAHRWKLVRLQPPHHQSISPASAGNDRGEDDGV
ncbi:hypothetical protein M8U68_24590, partial [Enterobacter hormaechei]|nr:hypothetical protein [Enterobacter hormaechei]